ncbi:MAG: CDP-alcohol phosphatidyltransferase family protein [Microbacteriaceae bacterium]|nr:MAG: CDP-alcohol phosphatidyltransferase family protein [Microbacteriaceae bacterium]
MIDQIRSTQECSCVRADSIQVARHAAAAIHRQTIRASTAALYSDPHCGPTRSRTAVPAPAVRFGRLESVTVTDAGTVSSRVLTVPNILSFFRLALVPVFIVLIVVDQDALALIALVVASATDFFDGFLARRLNQVSRLGQLLDPAVDRLYIFATLIGLAWRELIPWWLVAVVVSRDVMLAVLGIILANFGYGPLPVHRLGKVATFCLLFALPLLLLGEAFPVLNAVSAPLGWALALWGAFLYWWAGIVYIIETARVVRASAAPQARQSDTLEAKEVDGD